MTTAMDCESVRIVLSPYLDGELDAEERKAFERHIEACKDCRAALDEARAMSRALRADVPHERAPSGLAARIQAGLAGADSRVAARRWYGRMPALAAASVALFLLGGVTARWVIPPATETGVVQDAAARDAVAAHVRALVSERTIDVASSDQHTVKPWFDGRVELAPPVEDLTGEGFRLIGGRVDFVGGRRVAALVYRHRQHVLTLFVTAAAAEGAGQETWQGYNLVRWSQGGMRFLAVSDLERGELERFAAILRTRIAAK